MASLNKKINNTLSDKQEVVSITYEEIGLFPRSFSRVLDRFIKQVFSDVENLVIQEYRFYRYLFLTTLKCLLILVFVPLFVNFVAKTYIVRPLTEYFWNTKQTEIFLNSYQQKHAFAELKDFEEKIYFESLIYPKSASLFMPSLIAPSQAFLASSPPSLASSPSSPEAKTAKKGEAESDWYNSESYSSASSPSSLSSTEVASSPLSSPKVASLEAKKQPPAKKASHSSEEQATGKYRSASAPVTFAFFAFAEGEEASVGGEEASEEPQSEDLTQRRSTASAFNEKRTITPPLRLASLPFSLPFREINEEQKTTGLILDSSKNPRFFEAGGEQRFLQNPHQLNSEEKAESFLNAYSLKSSLFVYQTQEADKNIQQRYQEKTIELAQRYNDQSIEAITNFFADLISLISLFYLLYALEIQINITKSFLLEVFFGLDDSKKSLLILLITDLLVGYHSSNLWELFFEFLFHHYGLPESQTGIFLLVATLPVLLDVLFKYLIFRHLNRSSPATVATYHAMIE